MPCAAACDSSVASRRRPSPTPRTSRDTHIRLRCVVPSPVNLSSPNATGSPCRVASRVSPRGRRTSSSSALIACRRVVSRTRTARRVRRDTGAIASRAAGCAGSTTANSTIDAVSSRSTVTIASTRVSCWRGSSAVRMPAASSSESRSYSARSARPSAVSVARRTRRSPGSSSMRDEPVALERLQQPGQVSRVEIEVRAQLRGPRCARCRSRTGCGPARAGGCG